MYTLASKFGANVYISLQYTLATTYTYYLKVLTSFFRNNDVKYTLEFGLKHVVSDEEYASFEKDLTSMRDKKKEKYTPEEKKTLAVIKKIIDWRV